MRCPDLPADIFAAVSKALPIDGLCNVKVHSRLDAVADVIIEGVRRHRDDGHRFQRIVALKFRMRRVAEPVHHGHV